MTDAPLPNPPCPSTCPSIYGCYGWAAALLAGLCFGGCVQDEATESGTLDMSAEVTTSLDVSASDGAGGSETAPVLDAADSAPPDAALADVPEPDLAVLEVPEPDALLDSGQLDAVGTPDVPDVVVPDVPAVPEVSEPDAPAAPDVPGAPVGPDPGEPGSGTSSVATHELQLEGGVFPKNADLTIYLPDAAGPLPVVVFNHGFQLGTDQYVSYGEHLASWGYVVVLPQMPGSLLNAPNHKELKEYEIKVIDWIVANAAVADGPMQGKADATRIGLAGHSMGGKVALLTATADSRPIAVFGVDAVDAAGGPIPGSAENYPSVTPELMSQITVPFVTLGETTNASCSGFLCQACAPADDNFHQYFEHATGPALEIEVLGANHMSFLDNPSCGFACSACPAGSDDTATTRKLTRRYMTAFFNVVLGGDPTFEAYLTGPAMAADVLAGLVSSAAKNGF